MEKLIITCEIDRLPDDANVVDFQIAIMQDGWLTRIFKDWKKITYKRATITDMKVEKS